MKWFVLILGILITSLIGILFLISPPSPNMPATVNRDSKIIYTIGEKVKADPYGFDEWLDGEVSAITSEDEYVVHYCGNIGWFKSWTCETKTLLRSQMAKVQQPEEL